MSEIALKWGKKAKKALVGKRIVDAQYLTDDEMEGLGWSRRSIAIFLDDGTYILASTDDEGNGPGALFTSIKDLEVIPVCP